MIGSCESGFPGGHQEEADVQSGKNGSSLRYVAILSHLLQDSSVLG
ncbi:hypothetical protein [Niabella hibiscisoli]|nr:hypothetical protein [Niabella hibiscisoli]MCH5721145.1 hypothetical protein [Niabella hibiscisoli]